jgi:hypothetical protein
MTDLVTGNQIDIAAFDSGVSNPLLGSRAADWVEDRGRDAMNWISKASQDQEGIGDDILRGAGSVLSGAGAVMNAPGIKQAMQVLDAGSHYGGKLGGNLAKSIGIDPRIGGLAGNLVGDAVTGGFVRKAPKIAGKLSDQAASFAAKHIPSQVVYADSTPIKKSPFMIPKDQIQTLARKNLDQPPNVKLAQKIPKDDFPFLSEQLQKEVNLRNRSIDTQQGGMQRILDRIKGIEEGAPDPLFKRKDGRPRTKSQVLNHLKTKAKEYKRRLVDLKVRDLEHPKRTFTAEIAKGLDRHHLAGLKWSEPFFDGLNATDAQELRRFAAKQNVFFGDDIRNRIDLPKNIHVNEPELNIHTWLNYVGGSHKKINLKGTSLDVRKAEMAKMIDMVKRSQIRLVELGYLDPRLTAGVSKKLKKGLKGLDPIQDLPMINMSKVDLQQDMLFQAIDKQLLDLRSKGF